MKTIKYIVTSAVLLALVSCGTAGRKQAQQLRAHVQSGNFAEAEKLVNSEKFFPEKESRLLKYLEMGMVQHLNRNYYQSLKSFDKAKDLSDKLFTVSIKKKLKSSVSNSNFDNYYGEKYERSMIRFYQVLNHYALYYIGKYEAHKVVARDAEGKPISSKDIAEQKLSSKKRRFHLSAARSVLLEWNALLDNYKSTSGGKVAYKDDLLAKIFGAFIHEQMGSRQDKRIALDLYKKAKKVLFTNFNMLETYNAKSKKFKKNFKKLPNMPLATVKARYVGQTKYNKQLLTFLNDRINTLTNGKKTNVFVLLENGFITPKKVKKFDFPIPTDSIPAAVQKMGGFVGFAGKVLNVAKGTAKNALPKIYFEMPQIPYVAVKGQQQLIVKNKAGKVVATKDLAVVNPLSNIASMTIDEQAISAYAKTGARVAVKHVAALASAYMIYRKQPNALGMIAAKGAYAAANKGIEATERADLRTWSTLPHNFRLTSFSLPKGEYTIHWKNTVGKKSTVQPLGKAVVDGKKTTLMKFRTY